MIGVEGEPLSTTCSTSTTRLLISYLIVITIR
ncbi:MAG: hypothetical protein AVDCRST_MAG58-2495 [uncultured Rubrobacteraceae bacterium]|uniref:Uncharacterized protein n=1 Tax=uncultured Rubrobacteraceae bacterium TaxID=349277 RepID=A0A6J4R3X5_9ACTN|nr:MAG: hypothetical protein AVDCRST_MAG58-2495 [uncultured Rubrobacteraceae bacterium]